jgi:hypothetical protein
MKQIIVRSVVAAILIGGTAARSGSQSKPDPQAFFAKNIGLNQEQIANIQKGQPVALALKSRIPDEIFVFGAIRINSNPESYIRFTNDIDRLRKIPEYLAIGSFSNPPRLSDLKGFTFDKDDISALEECKPGDCMVQVAAGGIETLQKSIQWSAPDAAQQVNQLLQKAALQRLVAYKQGGDKILGEYNDKKHPTVVAEHFKYMVSYVKALPNYLPGFYSYLINYPRNKPANVTDSFYWAKVNFGLKPTLRMLHVMTLTGKNRDEPAYIIAEKQLYSSHYFETALDLTFCIRDSSDPGKPGFYLVKVMGSEQAGLTGMKGSIVRKVAVGRSVSSLEKSLAVIKTTLENPKATS